jgi:hypothetical protein
MAGRVKEFALGLHAAAQNTAGAATVLSGVLADGHGSARALAAVDLRPGRPGAARNNSNITRDGAADLRYGWGMSRARRTCLRHCCYV